jgi:hypothetical protein
MSMWEIALTVLGLSTVSTVLLVVLLVRTLLSSRHRRRSPESMVSEAESPRGTVKPADPSDRPIVPTPPSAVSARTRAPFKRRRIINDRPPRVAAKPADVSHERIIPKPREAHPVLAVSLQYSNSPRVRLLTLPITVYLSNESAHEQVEAAVEDLLASVGGHIEHREDPIIGSWFRRMRARITRAAQSPNSQEAMTMVAHAAEARLVHAQDATVTSTMMQNLGPVLTALQSGWDGDGSPADRGAAAQA